MNEKKKGSIFDHLGLKLLALVIATIMWFLVMNVEDATIIKTISGIPVTMLNGESITENGNLYNVTDGEEVTILVQGPRSIVEGLEASNFSATADLSHLSVTNSTTISVKANDTVSIKDAKKLTITQVDEYVTLSIEEEVEKSVPVKVITTGTVASGYAMGTATTTPNMVTVSGPGTVIASIVEARAVVDVTGADKDITVTEKLGCIDGYGSAIEKDNITLSVENVKVSIPVYETKEIPISVSTAGTPHEGYGVKTINYEPSSIVVAGEKEYLDKIEQIEIKDVVITDATENIEKNISLNEYLPADVFVAADSDDEIAISVEIIKYSENEVNIPKTDIKMNNQSEELVYFVKTPDFIKVKLEGFEEDIADIKTENLTPQIDVGSLGPGDHEVTVTFAESDKWTIKESYTVIVEVKKKE